MPVTDTMEFGVPGVPLEPGDHICALYVSQTERDQIMLPFLRAGLQAGHKCFCVVDSSPTSQVLEDLGDDDATLAALSEHQLELFTAGETYLRTRPFSTGGILDFLRENVQVAAAEGDYAFSRITGEMPWALHDLPDEREEFFRYEAELNRFAPKYPQAILCLYDLGHFGGGILLDLLRTHPKLVVSGQLVENPYYLSPDQYLSSRS
ncbi:MAG TPA: MEDS domain-containing protein [Actinomycetota bacterium]